jgi:hypothetical protein
MLQTLGFIPGNANKNKQQMKTKKDPPQIINTLKKLGL